MALPAWRAARIVVPPLAFLLLATPVPLPPSPPPLGPVRASLHAEPLSAAEAPPGARVGALVLLRGWDLSSAEPRFGGLSAMHVEGDRVIAAGDSGAIFVFPLPRRAGSLPLAVTPLARGPGADKASLDAEALVRHGDRTWLALEGANAIIGYRPGQPATVHRPRAMAAWRSNSGPEALVRLASGAFLAFSEGRADRRFSAVALFAGDPADRFGPVATLRYRRPLGYRVTDAALLPDGRLLLLHRRIDFFDGPSAILAIADPARLRPGAILLARPIARLAAPLAVDNMEALAVTREGGRTIVRLASDDNFMAFQRTLLLEFALDE